MIHNIAKRQECIQFRWPEKDDDNLFLFFYFFFCGKTENIGSKPKSFMTCNNYTYMSAN